MKNFTFNADKLTKMSEAVSIVFKEILSNYDEWKTSYISRHHDDAVMVVMKRACYETYCEALGEKGPKIAVEDFVQIMDKVFGAPVIKATLINEEDFNTGEFECFLFPSLAVCKERMKAVLGGLDDRFPVPEINDYE